MSDNEKAATKADLRELRIELKTDILHLQEEIQKLRNSLWLNVAVPSLTLIVSLVIHYIFR